MKMIKLDFAPYDKVRDEEVRELFLKYPHKDHQLHIMGAEKRRVATYLSETLAGPGCLTICMRAAGCLVGLISLQALPWMSDHFGLRMYAVRHLLTLSDGPLEHVRLLRFVMEELPQVDFLDCRIAVDDIHSAHALEVCGFRYVGTEMFLGMKIGNVNAPPLPSDVEVIPCRYGEQKHVLDIVTESHVHNRFVYDPMIHQDVARSLYRKLVKNCFDSHSFSVLVARSNESVEGFITAKVNEPFSKFVGIRAGSLDFIGVRPKGRRRGLGVALNGHALKWLQDSGAEFAAVRTLASNYPAICTLFRSGFSVTSSSLHFHKWIHRPRIDSYAVQPAAKNVMRLSTAGTGSWIRYDSLEHINSDPKRCEA